MKSLTPDVLKLIAPEASLANCNIYAPLITKYAPQFDIVSRIRMSCYLSQILEESGQFNYLHELWGPTKAQKLYEPPSAKAKELGNTKKGDGFKFRGHGLIETTGRANHEKVSLEIFGDARLLDHPEILEEPEYAVLSSMHFWVDNHLNKIADTVAGNTDNLKVVTRVVNGSLTHYDRRLVHFTRAYKQLS